ncbi:MAG TPA: hypothetical protein VM620_11780 [Hyphomicrobium sp.]|jgi:hypothetical protein|nr:hypothetical protein [Hyphomicrobium sp.]
MHMTTPYRRGHFTTLKQKFEGLVRSDGSFGPRGAKEDGGRPVQHKLYADV